MTKRASKPNQFYYLLTALLALGLAFWILGLWQADFRIPFDYLRRGDVYPTGVFLRNLLEAGWSFYNDRVGAPGGQYFQEFPFIEAGNVVAFWCLSLFFKHYALILNSYYLLSFPLIALSALFVMRRFNVSFPTAILGSLLYTFMPYHFFRAEQHVLLSMYFLIPLVVLVSLWVLRGDRFDFAFFSRTVLRDPAKRKALFALGVCFLLPLQSLYYAFFGAYLVLGSGIIVSLRNQSWRPLKVTYFLLTALIIGLALNYLPTFSYYYQQGRNVEVVERQIGETEFYGLKIAQLVLPVTQHRIASFAALKTRYNRSTYGVNENDSASLGLIASGGFVFLLIFLLLGRDAWAETKVMKDLASLNLMALLLGTVGGLSMLFSLLVLPYIRSVNRISIFIAFLSLFAVMLILDRLRQYLTKYRWGAAVFVIFILTLGVGGILDQTSPRFIPAHDRAQVEYAIDADFVARLEKQLQPGDSVFQLPHVGFPQIKGRAFLLAHDHFRPVLHAQDLKWSYGIPRGSSTDRWAQKITRQDTPQLIAALQQAGFKGIYIDRFGYRDKAQNLVSQLKQTLGAEPLMSSNNRMLFFPLN